MDFELIKKECVDIRKYIARIGYESGRGHISSSLSMVEIFACLYLGGILDVEGIIQKKQDRDRLILSKGHASLAQCITMSKVGIMDPFLIDGFASKNAYLSTHPKTDIDNGIEITTGSLGQGLGVACGIAISAKVLGKDTRIFVVVGDGELQEGSNWESIMFAGHNKLNNITLIVDRNRMQIAGMIDDIVTMEPLEQRLSSFGFDVETIDGHNVEEIYESLSRKNEDRPRTIIANTIKGKGIPFIENQNGWHGKGLNETQYKEAIDYLERQYV